MTRMDTDIARLESKVRSLQPLACLETEEFDALFIEAESLWAAYGADIIEGSSALRMLVAEDCRRGELATQWARDWHLRYDEGSTQECRDMRENYVGYSYTPTMRRPLDPVERVEFHRYDGRCKVGGTEVAWLHRGCRSTEGAHFLAIRYKRTHPWGRGLRSTGLTCQACGKSDR